MSTVCLERPAEARGPGRAHSNGRAWQVFVTLNCIGLAAVAVWFRFYRLGTVPGLNGDEAWMGVQAVEWLRGGTVAWRTPTGNPINVFFFLPQAAMHAPASPSIALLRTPAIISGLLAIVVNLALCRRVFDRRTVIISTLMLAVLPVNIAYSRFAWDACQTVLSSILVMYPALYALADPNWRTRWLALSGVAFLGALIVHPTNIFLAPLWGVPAAMLWKNELLASARSIAAERWRWPAIAAVVLLVAAVSWGGRHWLDVIGGRFIALGDWLAFARDYQRLFSGVTVYQFIAGSAQPFTATLRWHDAAAIGAICLLCRSSWNLLREPGRTIDRCLVCGWALTVLGFFLVAGPKAIAPHFERYAICLVAPTGLVASRSLTWITGRRGWRGRVATLGCLAAAWLMLASFDRCYFQFIERTGGESHRAFRTAETEPKAAALAHIRAASPAGEHIWIIADDWWTYWPLRYLAQGDPRCRVIECEQSRDDRGLREAMHPGSVWRLCLLESSAAVEEAERADVTIIVDRLGRPVIALWRDIE